jgi:hypothetical protein
MWMSSTATPAATGGAASEIGREEGESRAKPLPARGQGVCTDFGDEAGILRDGLGESVLDLGEVLV